jgi:hypothetical protein
MEGLMESLPAPHEADDEDRQGNTRSRQDRGRRKPGVLSPEECLVALSALPKLVALKLITPQQANSMRASYEAILAFDSKQGAGPSRRTADHGDLRQVLKDNPHLANYFVSVLSEEEIEELLAGDEDCQA